MKSLFFLFFLYGALCPAGNPCLKGLPCKAYDLKRGNTSQARQPLTFPFSGGRFYFSQDSFRIDSLLEWARNLPHPTPERFPLLVFFRLITDDYSEAPYEQRVASMGLEQHGKQWKLVLFLFTPKSEEWKKKTLMIVEPCAPLCLEYRLSLLSDTVAGPVAFRVNGKIVWEEDMTPLGFRVRRLLPKFGIQEPKYAGSGRLHIGGTVFGNNFPGDMPGAPEIGPGTAGRSYFNALGVTLFSPAYASFLCPTRHTASQFQIRFSGHGWDLPLYDSGPDTSFRDSVSTPAALDPAKAYEWRVRHLNEEGNFSAWSGPAALLFRPDTSLIKRPSIDGIRWGTKAALEPGVWYDVALKTSDPAGFKNLAYAVVMLNNSGFTSGMPDNKGGPFDPAGNYYVNLSLNPDKIFEKNVKGKYSRTRLMDSTGLYADARRAVFFQSPSDSTLRFRMRLLPGAVPGKWCVRAAVWNSQERPSFFYYDTISVVKRAVPRKKRTSWILFVAVAAALGVVLRRRRLSAAPPALPTREQKIFEDFAAYVRANLKNELSRREIENAMKMSYSNVYRIVRMFSKASIKNYILKERIEKAKALLTETRLNVTEVMMESGFSDSAHFSRSFKKHVGAPPTDFRKEKWGET